MMITKRGYLINSAWHGHLVSTARKAGNCQYGKNSKGICKNIIKVGDLFLNGERNDEAGGYGQDRYCLECATEFCENAATVKTLDEYKTWRDAHGKEFDENYKKARGWNW